MAGSIQETIRTVSETAGTTRDTIEEVISLKGIPLRLVDTAGVRDSADAVEREGIARTEMQIADAELILEVVDGSQARPEGFETLVEPSGKRHLMILNKKDLGLHESWESEAEGAVAFSCETREGVGALEDCVYRVLTRGEADWGANPVAINARHKDCLTRSSGFMSAALAKLKEGESAEFVALELREALEGVGEIVGKVDVEEILGEIFASFCIGK